MRRPDSRAPAGCGHRATVAPLLRALAALVLLGLASASHPARAQSQLEVGAGLDYRYVYYSFESYGSGGTLYTDEAFRQFGVGVDAAWTFALSPRLSLGPAAGLGVTFGGYRAWVDDVEVGTGDGTGFRVELSAQGGYQLTPKLRGLLRLGIGMIGTTLQPGPDVDPYRYEHDEDATAVLASAGASYEVAPGFDVALLYQTALGYISASTDYRPTGYEPTALDYATHSVQLRVGMRFGVTGATPPSSPASTAAPASARP